ncbi:hypothetical protein P3G55_06315 [Leptospira sp. 96542]|nr:hypothetical protein [Leptospira sp. 96542]
MNKKIIYVILSFLVLFGLFYFMEDHPENITETNYWKENWTSVYFEAPKDDWCGNLSPSFIKEPLLMVAISRGWKKPPLYSLSFDWNGKKYTYEGNYNVKNTFSELSALKTKLIEKQNDDLKKEFCLGSSSPSLTVSSEVFDPKKTENFKKLIFGKKIGSDEGRVATMIGDEIISPYNYVIEKFRTTAASFRERTLVSFNGGYIGSLSFSGQSVSVKIDNRAKKNQYNNYVNDWSRTTGERIVIPPDLGNQWETVTKGLKADLYPDEEGAPQWIEVSEPEAVFLVEQSEGIRFRIVFYPAIQTESGTWRPVKREIPPYLTESVSFLKEESFQNLVEAVMKVKNASRYERPNQKIQ